MLKRTFNQSTAREQFTTYYIVCSVTVQTDVKHIYFNQTLKIIISHVSVHSYKLQQRQEKWTSSDSLHCASSLSSSKLSTDRANFSPQTDQTVPVTRRGAFTSTFQLWQ